MPHNAVRFAGHLDATTLGGAGFTAQYGAPLSTHGLHEGSAGLGEIDLGGDDSGGGGGQEVDLSGYGGLEVDVGGGDGRVYTLVLKEVEVDAETVGKGERVKGEDGVERENGMETRREEGKGKATVSWEATFQGVEGRVWIPWAGFRATFRGKEGVGKGGFEKRVGKVGIMIRRCVFVLLFFILF